MDDDDLRRGQPTCHKQFDEATAILTGDALQTLAFQMISEALLPAEIRLKLIRILCQHIGHEGMILGQVLDLKAENTHSSLADVRQIHHHKTGKLIQAAVLMGGTIAGCNQTELDTLSRFGDHFGLAFQIRDDILEHTGRSDITHKSLSDQENNKSTFPSVMGLDAAKVHLIETKKACITALNSLPYNTRTLNQLLDFIRTDDI